MSAPEERRPKAARPETVVREQGIDLQAKTHVKVENIWVTSTAALSWSEHKNAHGEPIGKSDRRDRDGHSNLLQFSSWGTGLWRQDDSNRLLISIP